MATATPVTSEETPRGRRNDADEALGRRLFALKWEAAVTFCRNPTFIWKELRLSEDGLTVTGHNGYGLARCTRGFVEGCWYFEATVQHALGAGNCRIGWVQSKRETQLQAYPGFDEWGYGYRDLEGTYFHRARACGAGPAYGSGDVIGCLLYIPPEALAAEKTQALLQEGFKAEFDACVAKIQSEVGKETQCDIAWLQQQVPGSQVIFFKNGVPAAPAFTDVLHGIWFPAVGVYRGGRVTANFGPEFRFPPSALPGIPTPRPICELRRVMMLSLGAESARGLAARLSKKRRCDPDAKHFFLR